MGNAATIKRLADERGIALSFISKSIGKSEGYLGNAISRNADIPTKYLPAVAEVLGVSVNTIRGLDEGTPYNNATAVLPTFGIFQFERFATLCKEQGKKQSHLYEMVGMQSKAGSNLKKTKSVKPEILEVWAQELNTSVAYLNGETDDPSPMQKEKPAAQGNGLEEKFSGLLDKMSQDEQANVLKYMEFVLSNRDSGNQ